MGRMNRKAERAAWTEFVTGEKAPTNKFNVAPKEERGKYASKAEADLAQKYDALARAGQILDLQEQVRIEILPGDGVEGGVAYIADFTFFDLDGIYHIIDCKGAKTQVYKLKKKLLWHLKKIRIEEVNDGRQRTSRRR